MWKKVAIAGAVAAGIVGAGTAALAATGSPSQSAGAPAGTSGTAHHRQPEMRAAAKNFEHGSFVENRKGTPVTHDAIQGRVQGTPGSTITVKATDGTAWTYTVGSSTKVWTRENGKGSAKQAAIGDVKPNDHVVVIGTDKSGARTAARIVDLGTA